MSYKNSQTQKHVFIGYFVEKSGDIGFAAAKIPINKPPISRIVLMDQFENSMSIEVILDYVDIEFARKTTDEFIREFLDKISYFYNLSIGKPQLNFIHIRTIDEEDNIVGDVEPIPIGEIKPPRKVSTRYIITTADSALTKLLSLPNMRLSSLYYKQYSIAIQSPDPVAQYMLLYGILVQIFTAQRKVDSFIRKIEPDVKICWRKCQKSSKTLLIEETIYTRLRNLIAHADSNNTFEQVIISINSSLVKLRKLTKTAIEEQISTQ